MLKSRTVSCLALSILLGLLSSSTAAVAQPEGTFVPTGQMRTARSHHTATLLQDGKVLITGGAGENGETLSSAELYNPSVGTFSSTGSMTAARGMHTATLLADGRVLIAGGWGLSSAEIISRLLKLLKRPAP